MVGLKLAIIAFFIIVGAFYVKPDNWVPFAPNGFRGISSAAAIIFFAYIGFDAVSTAAEETKNPQRDMPIAMIASLVICTVIYILVALVLTGMLKWTELGTAEPLATAFSALGMHWAAGSHFARRRVRHHVRAGRVPARPAAHLLLDGARRPAAAVGGARAPEVPHAPRDDDPDRRGRGHLRHLHEHQRGGRADQHRDAVRLRPRGPRRDRAAARRSRTGRGRSARRWCRGCRSSPPSCAPISCSSCRG